MIVDVNCIATLPGHQNPVYTVEQAHNQHVFYTAGNDKGIVEWNLDTPGFSRVLMPVQSSVYALHAPANKPVLLVGERSGSIQIYNFEDSKPGMTLKRHALPVFDIRSINYKNEFLAASEDGTVTVWSLENYQLLYQFAASSDTIRTIAISSDEKWIALGCKDNYIRIYQTEDYSLVCELKEHTLPVTSLAFSPDGTTLISGSRDAHLKLWDTASFSLLQDIPAHLFAIYDIKFHPALPLFATASRDKSIKIWDTELRLKKVISIEKGYPSHTHSVNKLLWTSNKTQLVSVSDDKKVIIWEVQAVLG
ncbi:WD40 repeat domain-containing protein [Pedobacter sp. BS3]|uniref:WD40 repeat domain-containing protein n=1 Tax=Pedobacter sp. BS3 TaxID=2567937 RepID=UPI0011EE6268|nr:WD40 repeat domain-containing protein [Pedobacter sp. BS3]TZF83067.1 WD40 repeat domain-containing protein [Pedobacter sp. BS3]